MIMNISPIPQVHSNIRTFEHSNISHSNISHSNIRTFEHSNISHKGSALLIVLGMLAFMVISAVAFSAYMRYARLPSSFLRQTSSSRLLAKAAMAKAIDEIDAAIGNMPHPGVWNVNGADKLGDSANRYKYPRTNGTQLNRNLWLSRIYIGNSGDEAENDVKKHLVAPYRSEDEDAADPDENAGTASVLCLEGLAYIPPPLVNEARYYSRRSNAAKWKTLDYDAGRYAFCAIDVSDFFDVNALAANVPRSSSSAGRISLSYLFQDLGQLGAQSYPAMGSGGAAAWDTFMETIRGKATATAFADGDETRPAAVDAKVPLVSLADFNLAVGSQSPAGVQSPFYEYVQQGAGEFFGGAGIDQARRMTFVTDSWFPMLSGASTAAAFGFKLENPTEELKVYNLAREEEQPFPLDLLQYGKNPTLRTVTQISGDDRPSALIRKNFGYLGLAALYDYLDEDSVPVSLAIPSVEHTPMIAGISLQNMSGTLAVTGRTAHPDTPSPQPQGTEGATKRMVRQKFNYFLVGDVEKGFAKVIQNGAVNVTVAYPFVHGNDLKPHNDKFTLEGNMAFFFSIGDCPLRTDGNTEGRLYLKNESDFDDKSIVDGAVIRVPLKFSGLQNKSFTDVVEENQTAVSDLAPLRMNANMSEIINFFQNTPLVTVELEWEQTKPEEGNAWFPTDPPDDAAVTSATSAFKTVNDEREPVELGNLTGATPVLTVRSAIWLRLKNGDNRTVDLVPACIKDDQVFLGKNNSGSLPDEQRWSGTTYPLMRFSGRTGDELCRLDLTYDNVRAGFSAEFGMAPANVMCADPRWNWAPENWYVPPPNVTIDQTTWRDQVKMLMGGDYRDNDIMLATSDAGYMQSVYELAFLPRFMNKAIGAPDSGNEFFSDLSDLNAKWVDFANLFDNAKNRHLMWRSYHPYARVTRKAYDGAELDMGFRNGFGGEGFIVSGGGGFKINPYSDDTNVVMAAFANTPLNWLVAADLNSENVGLSPEDRKKSDYAQKYTFCEKNPDARLGWQALYSIESGLMRTVRSLEQGESWTAAFDDLDWDGDDSWFCGLMQTPETSFIHDIDRKFLYGYWRECFAVQQQLFLVFVRAEPTMLGGGAIGRIPPTLGARAVALVWRDPSKTQSGTNGDPNPHKTRILFYRQFE